MPELKKNEIADLGELSPQFVYSLFSGARSNPTRDNAIKLCFGMGLNCEESNILLRKAGKGELYIRDTRDCIILYYLKQFERKNAEARLLTMCNCKLRDHGENEIV